MSIHSVVDLARQIIEMHEEIQYLRSEVAYYKPFEKKYMDALDMGIQTSQSIIGSLMTAALDPDSVISRGLKAGEA